MDISRFETQARRLRYRALGQACEQDGRDVLFLAHHSDDNTETILMRLAAGHKGAGLSGISSVSDIPECWGMHGVHQSGRYEAAAARHSQISESFAALEPLNQRKLCKQETPTPKYIFETGGIQLMRPLLAFSKHQLVATCQAESVLWEEDKTNEDVTQTPRNTIRSLLDNDRLPQALRKESLRGLASSSMMKRRVVEALARMLLEACEIRLLELRSGLLLVRMPMLINLDDDQLDNDTSIRQKVAAMLIRWLANLVSPCEEVSQEQLYFAMKAMFPDLRDQSSLTLDSCARTTNFTAGGVHFRRITKRILRSESCERRDKKTPIPALDQDFFWCLSRQSYTSPLKPLIIRPSVTPDLLISNAASWNLWDGRYWIRVSNASSDTLVIRSLRANDLTHLRTILDKKSWRSFHNLLADVAPGKVRYTLPIIAVADDQDRGPGNVFVLPTLGREGWLRPTDKAVGNNLRVELRYKTMNCPSKDEHGERGAFNVRTINTWQD